MKLRRGDLLSLLTVHFAVLALLLILNLKLAIRLFFAWNTLHTVSDEQLHQQKATYRAMQIEMSPLKGLPEKVTRSSKQADEFYAARFPAAYSTITADIYALSSKNTVRLTNLAYTPALGQPGWMAAYLDASL